MQVAATTRPCLIIVRTPSRLGCIDASQTNRESTIVIYNSNRIIIANRQSIKPLQFQQLLLTAAGALGGVSPVEPYGNFL